MTGRGLTWHGFTSYDQTSLSLPTIDASFSHRATEPQSHNMALNVAQSPLHNFTFPQVPKSGFENFATCAFPLPPLTPPPLRPQVQETHHQRTFQHVRATAQHSSSSSSSRFHIPRQGQAFVHASSCGVIAKAETARRFITLSDRTQKCSAKATGASVPPRRLLFILLDCILRRIGSLVGGGVLLFLLRLNLGESQ